jgi:hypothetical protein
VPVRMCVRNPMCNVATELISYGASITSKRSHHDSLLFAPFFNHAGSTFVSLPRLIYFLRSFLVASFLEAARQDQGVVQPVRITPFDLPTMETTHALTTVIIANNLWGDSFFYMACMVCTSTRTCSSSRFAFALFATLSSAFFMVV